MLKAKLSQFVILFLIFDALNLTTTDLSGVDLRSINLDKVILSGAILAGANLLGLNFKGYDLSDCNLKGVMPPEICSSLTL